MRIDRLLVPPQVVYVEAPDREALISIAGFKFPMRDIQVSNLRFVPVWRPSMGAEKLTSVKWRLFSGR